MKSSRINIATVIFALATLAMAGLAGCNVPDDGPYVPPHAPQQSAGENTQQPGTQQDGGEAQDSGTQQPTQEKNTISYNLPDGWSWTSKEAGMAIWEHRSKDNAIPYVKFDPCLFRKGTEAEAKNSVYSIYLEDKQQCENRGSECVAQPVYKEMNIGGTTAYMEMMKDYDSLGGISWGTSLAFVKDGYVACFTMFDKGDLYVPELTKIIQSLKVTKQ